MTDEQQISSAHIAAGNQALAAGCSKRNSACGIQEVSFWGGLFRADETCDFTFAPLEAAERSVGGGQG